jgi:hypothetical protein
MTRKSISKSILAAIAIAATVGIVSPASAEFLETGTATNNAEGGFGSGGYGWTAPHNGQVIVDRNGLNAYAMVPGAQGGSIDNPGLTGGGSAGYNQLERQDR